MKKYLFKISYTVLPVWLFFVGMAVYLWAINDNSGDLMRLGLIDSGPEYTDSICRGLLSDLYYESQDNDSILRADTCDVVVIGDSFSHGGGVGKKGDYVNYLAHDSGRRVVVFSPQDPTLSSPMQVAYDILNLGVIDSCNVKNLVVEEGERYLLARHSGFVTNHWELPRAKHKTADESTELKQDEGSPLLRVKDYLFYHLFGDNPIYTLDLNKDMFGGKEPRKLYFYFEDVDPNFGYDITTAQQQAITDCFGKVIAKAREKGVNLIIVLACDKYDLYQDFIVDNPYPPKTLNEDIERWMQADINQFVVSKNVLHPYVSRGVKDVFLFNDTHWSPWSSRVIAAEVIKKLK